MRLQPRGEVRRLADDTALSRLAGADKITDDYQAGGETDPTLELQIAVRLESVHGSDEIEAGAHRPLGVVFVRLRIPEINEDTVAHVLRDEAVEAVDRLRHATVIRPDDLT